MKAPGLVITRLVIGAVRLLFPFVVMVDSNPDTVSGF
jgi:hypothetical protein